MPAAATPKRRLKTSHRFRSAKFSICLLAYPALQKLRLDHEASPGDDNVAILQTGRNLRLAVPLIRYLDGLRFEGSCVRAPEDYRSAIQVLYRFLRDEQSLPDRTLLDIGLGKHAGVELSTPICDQHPSRQGAGLRVQFRPDVGDPPRESFVRVGLS